MGSIGAFRDEDVYRLTAEVGYWLAEPFWGRKIMTEAVKQFCRLAFQHWPDLVRIEAGVFSSNPASQRVLTKAGFTLEGIKRKNVVKNGKILDTVMLSLLREDVEKTAQ